jgi:hypothetical protein
MDRLPRALRGAPPRADKTEEGINLSQLIDAERCGYRWHLRHRRGIERRIIAPPMDLGSAVHEGIAGGIRRWVTFPAGKITSKRMRFIFGTAAYAVLSWAQEWAKHRGQLSDETQQQLSDTVAKANIIAARALEEMNLPRWRIVRLRDGSPLVEQKITWPLPFTDVPFYGTADFVADDLDEGGRWVWDYKVRERFTSSEDEQFDCQLPTYQYGLLKQNPPIHTVGSIKFQIRAELPSQPKLNKDGTMSRQRIATTWDVYEKALLDAIKAGGKYENLHPKYYREEMQQKLDVKFFSAERIHRSTFLINQMWNEITVPMAKRFLARKSFHRFMHTWGCNGCWARDFCMGELRGEDTRFLLSTSFVDTNNPAERMILSADDIEFVEN